MQSIRKWVSWTTGAPCGSYWRAGYVVMLLIFPASCPVREMPLFPVSHSWTYHAWIFSLAFCWNLAAISISSAGIYSLIMNISWIGGWGCCWCIFACIRGWMAPDVSSVSLSITTSSFSSLYQGFHLLAFQSVFVTSTWILIHSGLHSLSFAKRHAC